MSAIEKLVGRQIEMAELRRLLERKEDSLRKEHTARGAYGPCLLISRKCGSGGTTLARWIGERLKWQVFDREIVDEVARTAHVRRKLIESVDERVRSGWSEFRRKLAEGEGIGREQYLRCLRELILSLGHHGNVVILGRGAIYILPPESAVRVRLSAPVEVRALRVAERERIPLIKARHRIDQIDTERAAFIREAFDKDVNSPENYDLVLDTAEISIEAAAERVLAKLHEKLHVPAEATLCGR